MSTAKRQNTNKDSTSPFKARPMPDFTPGFQTSTVTCSLKTLTKAQPFNLNTETRGAEKQAKLNSANQFKDESVSFKAREMPNFDKNTRNLSVSPLRVKPPT